MFMEFLWMADEETKDSERLIKSIEFMCGRENLLYNEIKREKKKVSRNVCFAIPFARPPYPSKYFLCWAFIK